MQRITPRTDLSLLDVTKSLVKDCDEFLWALVQRTPVQLPEGVLVNMRDLHLAMLEVRVESKLDSFAYTLQDIIDDPEAHSLFAASPILGHLLPLEKSEDAIEPSMLERSYNEIAEEVYLERDSYYKTAYALTSALKLKDPADDLDTKHFKTMYLFYKLITQKLRRLNAEFSDVKDCPVAIEKWATSQRLSNLLAMLDEDQREWREMTSITEDHFNSHIPSPRRSATAPIPIVSSNTAPSPRPASFVSTASRVSSRLSKGSRASERRSEGKRDSVSDADTQASTSTSPSREASARSPSRLQFSLMDSVELTEIDLVSMRQPRYPGKKG